jgi:hypothetical protein
MRAVTSDERSLYLHIAYIPKSAGWLLPIITAVKGARSPQLRRRADSWPDSDLSQLGLAVSTKLAILPHVSQGFQSLLDQLGKEVADLKDLEEHIQEQAGFVPKDGHLPYRLLASIDAFIYEFRSTYEIVGRFLVAFSARILGSQLTEQQVTSLLRESGISDAWVADLADQRKVFFHNTAPWIAVKIVSRRPLACELLILRRNVRDLEGSPEVIEFDRVKAVQTGLFAAMHRLQAWLIDRVVEVDTDMLRNVPS